MNYEEAKHLWDVAETYYGWFLDRQRKALTFLQEQIIAGLQGWAKHDCYVYIDHQYDCTGLFVHVDVYITEEEEKGDIYGITQRYDEKLADLEYEIRDRLFGENTGEAPVLLMRAGSACATRNDDPKRAPNVLKA